MGRIMKYIDSVARPFTEKEARAMIGRYIKKRPGVFMDDNGSVYKLLEVKNGGFGFFEGDYYHDSYQFDNIIYDYLFTDDSFIGIKIK